MKSAVYIGLLLFLVPLQSTILHHLSINGIQPDVCLVASVLVGLFGGVWEGIFIGAALGALQGVFSAGDIGVLAVLNGVTGLLAGLLGQQLTSLAFGTVAGSGLLFSIGWGTLFLFYAWHLSGTGDIIDALRVEILPKAAYDTVILSVGYWMLRRYFVDRHVEDVLVG